MASDNTGRTDLSTSGHLRIQIFCASTLAAVGAALVSVTSSASSGGETVRDSAPRTTADSTSAGRLSLTVRLSASGRGTFSSRGLFADQGQAQAEKRSSPKRVRLRITLTGKSGKFRVVLTQLCGASRSTWAIVVGTKEYRDISGRGTGTGRIPCGLGASRLLLSGQVTNPVQRLAAPGTYRGSRPSVNMRTDFDVLSTGRALTNVSFKRILARCGNSRIVFLEPRFSGRYPIDSDRSFSIEENGYTVSGTFSMSSARGTIAYDTGECRMAPVSWSAANPPTALPRVPSGRYCGFTDKGPGICLDATTDARVVNASIGANLRCHTPDAAQFDFSINFAGSIEIRPDFTFRSELAGVPLEGGGAVTWIIEGRFDGKGEVAGSGGYKDVSLLRNGKLYKCRPNVATWTARLGR